MYQRKHTYHITILTHNFILKWNMVTQEVKLDVNITKSSSRNACVGEISLFLTIKGNII